MSGLRWTCELHGFTTTGDCHKCDDELIALTKESGKTCNACGRSLLLGESAWAADWVVVGAESTRLETRYTCDECEAAG